MLALTSWCASAFIFLVAITRSSAQPVYRQLANQDAMEQSIVEQLRMAYKHGNLSSIVPMPTIKEALETGSILGFKGVTQRSPSIEKKNKPRGKWHQINRALKPKPWKGTFASMDSSSSSSAPPETEWVPLPLNVGEWERKEMQLGCAWSVTVMASTYNVAFPDLNCVYQVLLFWGVTSKTMLRIEGDFPDIRYFSYQSYEIQSGQPIASLIDYEIEPSNGINPFNDKPMDTLDGQDHDEEEDNFGEDGRNTRKRKSNSGGREERKRYGRYQIHMTDTGARGVPNELAATTSKGHHRCTGRGCVALVILRLYAADPGQDAFHGHKPGREWGYVAPPEVSVRYASWENSFTGKTIERYKELPLCDPAKNTPARAFLDWKVPQLEGDWTSTSDIDNINNNFIVYTQDTSTRSLFPNADANYLFATAINNRTIESSQGKKKRKQLVARITGRLPTVAHGLTTEPFIAEQDTYDARYVSLSTMALKGAGPVIDTIVDVAIEQKYLSTTSASWNEERQFSVVAAPGLNLLKQCPPTIYAAERDLFLTTTEPDTGKPPHHVAFLYRQILSRWQTSGHKDQSIARAKHECLGQEEKKKACRLRTFFAEMMGPQYPSITYFYCWRNETKGCTCEDSKGKVIGWGDTEGTDLDTDDDHDEGGLFGGTNEEGGGLLHHHHHHGFNDDPESDMASSTLTTGKEFDTTWYNITEAQDYINQTYPFSLHSNATDQEELNPRIVVNYTMVLAERRTGSDHKAITSNITTLAHEDVEKQDRQNGIGEERRK